MIVKANENNDYMYRKDLMNSKQRCTETEDGQVMTENKDNPEVIEYFTD